MGGGRDAKLLRLMAEFNAASDQWDKATAKTAQIEEAIDRPKSRLRKSEKKEGRKAAKTARVFNRIMKTRSKGLVGLLVKVKVRDRWNTDDEASEITILESLVADLKGMAKP
jgi:hypothetical protein